MGVQNSRNNIQDSLNLFQGYRTCGFPVMLFCPPALKIGSLGITTQRE